MRLGSGSQRTWSTLWIKEAEFRVPLYNLFYEANNKLKLNAGKGVWRKENYRPIYIMDIDTELLNKI